MANREFAAHAEPTKPEAVAAPAIPNQRRRDVGATKLRFSESELAIISLLFAAKKAAKTTASGSVYHVLGNYW
jgi:hypothetical protein